MRKIILASTSPRRREILEKLRIPFTVEESGYEEDMTLKLVPHDLVKQFALGKARAVAIRHKDAIVIGGDTVVVLGKKIFGKPHTKQRAHTMLNELSGKKHKIITGLAIVDSKSGKKIVRAIETIVTFRTLSDSEIDSYIQTGEPLDRAGAYAIQGYGAAFVKDMVGDFYNAMGMPLFGLRDELKKFGVK